MISGREVMTKRRDYERERERDRERVEMRLVPFESTYYWCGAKNNTLDREKGERDKGKRETRERETD